MNKYQVLADLVQLITVKPPPTTVWWNRLEGRPRRADFTRALQAEVRDPLWLITRQWQMGEFQGEDAGSPVTAKVAWRTDPVTAMRAPGGAEVSLDADQLIEPLVEARPVPMRQGSRKMQLRLRMFLGKRWVKMLTLAGHAGLVPAFRGAYGFDTVDPAVPDDNEVTAHVGAWQTATLVAGRSVDGGAVMEHLKKAGALASDGLGLAAPTKDEVDALGIEFLSWADSRYKHGIGGQAWSSHQLEYTATVDAAKGEAPASLQASEYRGGRMDWFNFEAVEAEGNSDGAASSIAVSSFIPTQIQFEGMPHTRHWSFEEGAVSFGDIKPDTTDLAKLLLIEFGLVAANDWFLLPIELPVGSLTSIRGLAVTNVFGERTWVEAAVGSQGPTDGWQMYRLSSKGADDDRLFIPTTAPAGLQGGPVESVSFVRDEVSNMVWAIETTIALSDGISRPGREAGIELRRKYQSAVPPSAAPPSSNEAKKRYNLMRWEAEHWIPFVPVHVDGSNREIQLQRAAMPRLLDGTQGQLPKKIRPRSNLVSQGLEQTPATAYFVAEEEVERAGTVVESSWQRCRGPQGEVYLWLGHRRRTGRGEASSGLAFDRLEPKTPGSEN